MLPSPVLLLLLGNVAAEASSGEVGDVTCLSPPFRPPCFFTTLLSIPFFNTFFRSTAIAHE